MPCSSKAIDEILAERSDAVIVLFSDHGGRMSLPGDEVHHSFLAARTPGNARLFAAGTPSACRAASHRRGVSVSDGQASPQAGPLILLAAVGFLLADAVIVWIGRGDFAFDFTCCYQQAAQRPLDDPATLYDWTDTYTFRYSPSARCSSRRWSRCR